MAQCAECGKPIGMVNWCKWRQWRFCSAAHRNAFKGRIEYDMKVRRVSEFLRFLSHPPNSSR